MSIFNCTIIIQRVREQGWTLSERLTQFLLDQQDLQMFQMPDLPADQDPIQVELKRNDVYLTFTLAATHKTAAQDQVNLLCQRIEEQFLQRRVQEHFGVAGFVNPETVTMHLDLVLQGLNPQALYAVFRTGAVYELHGDEKIHDLEDPYSPLYGEHGLRKLTAQEARAVLNGRSFTYVWSRRGSMRKHLPDSGHQWMAKRA